MTTLSRVTSALFAVFVAVLVGMAPSRAQESAVEVYNTTAGAVGIIGIAADNQQQLLHELPAGETYRLSVPAGTMLGFAQDGAWVGDAYIVTGRDNEAVIVPYVAQAADVPVPADGQAAEAAEAAAGQVEAPAESEVQITNSSDQPVVVIEIGADQTQQALKQLAAGETYIQPVQPGATLGFAQGDAWLGEPYVVSGSDGEAVTVPYVAQAATAGTVVPPGAAQGELQVTNGSDQPVAVIAIAADQSQQVLQQIAAGETASVAIAADVTLGFAQGDAWLGDAYVTTGAPGQAITLPYLAPQAKGPATEEFVETILPPVDVTNSSDQPILIVSIQPDNVQRALKEVAPGETYRQPATPGTTLAFAQGPTWLGDMYVTTGEFGEKVTVPYQQPSELQKAQQAPGSVEIFFDNTTGAPLTVAALNASGQVESLYELSGEPGPQEARRVLPGTKLWFYKEGGNELAGDPYVVTDATGETLTLPFSLSAALAAVHEGPGSVGLEFTNTNTVPIIVSVLDADGAATPIYEIPPGQIVTRRSMPGSTLYFFRQGEELPVADYFVVPESDAQLSLPYYYADELRAQQAGPGSVLLQIRNETYADIHVAIEGRDGGRADLYTVPYRNSADTGMGTEIQVMPGTRLFFFSDLTEEVNGEQQPKLEGTYTVQANVSPLIYVPFEPTMAGQQDPYPPGSITVMFRNSNSGDIPKLVLVDKDGKSQFSLLKSLESWRNFAPGTVLFPYGVKNPGDTKLSPIGEGIVVDSQPGAIIEIPTMSAAQLIASGKIDLDALTAQITANLMEAKLDSRKATACWRDTYGRGVGTVPRNCPPGQSEDTAGLCYDNCRSGYKPFVTMCVSTCPAGFTDTGLHCLKPGPVTRDAYPWEFGDTPFSLNDAMARCKADRVRRGGDCERANLNTIVYSTCPRDYAQAPVITNWCSPSCPAGMLDIGISCQKRTYDRGVGKLMVCGGNQQQDAGLCYNQCRSGFDGVGPVCWAQCPRNLPYMCGAACAKDKNACDQVIVDQVTSPIFTAASIAFIALTAGGGAAATGGLNAGKAGGTIVGKTSAELLSKAALREGARQTLGRSVRSALRSGAGTLLKGGGLPGTIGRDLLIDTAVGTMLTGAVIGGMSEQAKVDLRKQLTEKVKEQLVGQISDEEVNAIVNTAIDGSGINDIDFPWTAIDPTGIAEIVRAYNLPLCSKLH